MKRVISWVAVVTMMIFSNLIASWLAKLGIWLCSFLGEMTNFQIVICLFLFGGTYTGLVTYALTSIPMWIASLGDMIYPSNHAFRYYFCGVWQIIGCAILIICGICGLVAGGAMFWFYAQYIYLIIQAIILMVIGKEKAEERHKEKEMA